MEIKANNYKVNEVLRFIRQNTDIAKTGDILMNMKEADITLVT